MSAQGLEVIDHTVQITHEWINELGRTAWIGDRGIECIAVSCGSTLHIRAGSLA